MFTNTISVPDRVLTLKNLFADFGIPVLLNSPLEQAIASEFGRGKRSAVTQMLAELNSQSDAAKLAACIGKELMSVKDPKVRSIGNVLQEHLPALLEIVDIRQNVDKRQYLLSQLLGHFKNKLPQTMETERILRMLQAAEQNLKSNLNVKIIGNVVEGAGIFCDMIMLKRFGKILQGVAPALIALDEPNYPLSQKVNLCVQALRVLGLQLRETNILRGANIIEIIHSLANVALPPMSTKATIEQSLQTLGISLGTTTTKMLVNKAADYGLSEREMVQILYATSPHSELAINDAELSTRTTENQKYAAICGFVARLAQETKSRELEKIAVAGVCLASMRQTLFELKTHNLHAANFSESLGTILLGVGAITRNNTLTQVGNSILLGVSTYAGVMAAPGGAAIAIPLALCTVLGKLFLEPSTAKSEEDQLNVALNSMVNQIITLQAEIRHEFLHLHQEIAHNHQQLLQTLDQGFINLANMLQYNNARTLNKMHKLDYDLQDIKTQINHEFTDLYLEYVRDPLEEVDYATKYGGVASSRMQDSKHKLAMWLLYKSKHPKVNGLNCALEQLPSLYDKLQEGDAYLALINRYVNQSFNQNLPEDLPHIPTWLQAAHAYAMISAVLPNNDNVTEEQFLADVLAIGKRTIKFIDDLATNTALWERLQTMHRKISRELHARWHTLKLHINKAFMHDMHKLLQTPQNSNTWYANSAPPEQQLEPFTPIKVDITKVWHSHIAKHIPPEVLTAVSEGLGDLQIQFAIDRETNTFTEVRVPYGPQLLPDHGRDVLFRVSVFFREQKTKKMHPLTTTWLAYDLHDAKNRVEQYYKQKFKYGLRHNQYQWISVDGLSNQVEGHAPTSTRKLIDQDKLAAIYEDWLCKSVPVNAPETLPRVKQNPLFSERLHLLIGSGECTITHQEHTASLQVQLCQELYTLMQRKRFEYATLLQQDAALNANLQKLDVLNTILSIYMRLLNQSFDPPKKVVKFAELIGMLQESKTNDVNFLDELEDLFAVTNFGYVANADYLNSEFYLKMQMALTRLNLLQNQATFAQLRVA